MYWCGMRNLKIVVIPRGWLGNQLFPVFAAIQFAQKHNGELIIETGYGFERNKRWHSEYELNDLELPYKYEIIYAPWSIFQRIFRYLIRNYKVIQWLTRTKFVTEEQYFNDVPKRIKKVILDDFFLNEKFVNNFQGFKLNFHNATLESNLDYKGALAMHIRIYHDFEIDYTVEDQISCAMNFLVNSKYKNIVIYSNNTELVKEKLGPINNLNIIYRCGQSAKQDFCELSQFNNIFFFGSTYAWWAAYSFSKGKNVFIPEFTLKNGSGGYYFPGVNRV
jgi:hypothetical protein